MIDSTLDYVTLSNNETGDEHKIPVVQVWIDPKYPRAHRDPALRQYLQDLDMAGLVRYDSRKAITLFPPTHASDDEWHEVSNCSDVGREHSPKELVDTLGKAIFL